MMFHFISQELHQEEVAESGFLSLLHTVDGRNPAAAR